jgi:hypothetical protein
MLRFARFLGFEKTKKPAKSQHPLKTNPPNTQPCPKGDFGYAKIRILSLSPCRAVHVTGLTY